MGIIREEYFIQPNEEDNYTSELIEQTVVSSSFNIDLSNKVDLIRIILTCDSTINFINLPSYPITFSIFIKQDSNGNRTLTWGNSIKWGYDVSPVQTKTANYSDLFTFIWDGNNLFGLVTGQGFTV